MSKLLIKILKTSILPASVMIVGKLLGIYLTIQFFNIDLFLDNQVQGLFSVQLYINNRADLLLVQSVSNFTMWFLLTSVTLYMVVRIILFNMSHDDPRTIVKLTKLNLLKWVTDKETRFLNIFIWSFFSIAASAVVISNTIQSTTYEWVGAASFLSVIIVMWGLIKTFELETDKIYPKG